MKIHLTENSKRYVMLGIVLLLLVAFGYYLNTKKAVDRSALSTDAISPETYSDQADKPNIPSIITADSKEETAIIQRMKEKASRYKRYIELVSPEGYFNIDHNLTLRENIGKKVIIVDFWTYSCINCQRTLPYLNSWHEKYKDDGLLIIGVHTPEFDFEKKAENVARAIEKFKVKYPVVQDNDYQTWTAYKNRYWPRKYVIDIDGFIVYDHIGEGAYKETEELIQRLLEERKQILDLKGDIPKDISAPIGSEDKSPILLTARVTPEIYLGYGTSRGLFGNEQGFTPGTTVDYKIPSTFKDNNFYLAGNWLNNYDNVESKGSAQAGSRLFLKYYAREVHIVAGALNETNITVLVDGKKMPVEFRGKDVAEDGTVVIQEFGLYNLVTGKAYGSHLLEIHADEPGVMVYTYTFG